MKKLILIALVLIASNSMAEEVKIVCELSGIEEQGIDDRNISSKKDLKLFLYWTFDDVTNELETIRVDGDNIMASIFRDGQFDDDHLKRVSNDMGFKWTIDYYGEKHPKVMGVWLFMYREVIELNRYLGKSYLRGSSETYINSGGSEINRDTAVPRYFGWSVEGDCQLATKKF